MEGYFADRASAERIIAQSLGSFLNASAKNVVRNGFVFRFEQLMDVALRVTEAPCNERWRQPQVAQVLFDEVLDEEPAAGGE
jgi:hypothetical protein